QAGKAHAQTRARRLVHLAVDERHLVDDLRLGHFEDQVVALACALADAREDGHAAVLPRDVVDQLLDQHRLADTGAAEEADLAAVDGDAECAVDVRQLVREDRVEDDALDLDDAASVAAVRALVGHESPEAGADGCRARRNLAERQRRACNELDARSRQESRQTGALFCNRVPGSRGDRKADGVALRRAFGEESTDADLCDGDPEEREPARLPSPAATMIAAAAATSWRGRMPELRRRTGMPGVRGRLSGVARIPCVNAPRSCANPAHCGQRPTCARSSACSTCDSSP